MGRIDRSEGQDKTMERRHIHQMLRYIDEYDLVKSGKHPEYEKAQEFYDGRGVCKQNFLKYYRRFIDSGRKIESLIPHRSGRKFKDMLKHEKGAYETIIKLREVAYNRFDIARLLKDKAIEISPSTVYRLLKKIGLNKLNPKLKELSRRIVKRMAGELGHVDIHYISKGTVRGESKVYLLGIIDSYSRICWLSPLRTIKSLDVSFAAMELMMIMRNRYGIEFKEMMSDNGSEFSSRGGDKENHPFEKMLKFFSIKHVYTKPCSPKTNGKIERFWKTIEDELLDGETFESFADFEQHIRGYCIYYNEMRTHQGINLKKPADMIH